MNATTTAATEKQMAFIAGLIERNGAMYRQRAYSLQNMRDTTERVGGAYSERDLADWQRKLDAATVLAGVWQSVSLPAERMTHESASKVIDRLRSTTAFYALIEQWLDNERMARTYGVANYINEHRAAIERALRETSF